MRILFSVHHQLTRDSGAPGATLQLGEALEALGHDVSFYSWDQLPARLSPRAQELLFPGFLRAHLAGLRGAKLPEVVDAMTGDAWLFGSRRRGKAPLLVTRAHGLEHRFYAQEVEDARAAGRPLGFVTSAYHGHLRLWQVKRSLRRADLCLFLNDSDRAYAIERLDVLASHTRTVHNGVPDSLLEQGAVQATGDKAGGIAVVGSWATRKGIDYGVPALNTLLARHTNLTVALLGTGVAADVIVGQFDPAIRSRVEVVASYARSDLPDLLRGRSINLFPTLAEGQSLALLETMACGLVPVTTAAGGEGVVRDGFNGLEVQAREAGALVVAVERLLNDHTLLRQLCTQALETARARSWRSAASQLVELYEAALTARA